MIKINCDRCHKNIDWRKHPAFLFMSGAMYQNSCSTPTYESEEYNTIESITIKSKDGTRYLDLCDECKHYVYNFIFDQDNIKSISKEDN